MKFRPNIKCVGFIAAVVGFSILCILAAMIDPFPGDMGALERFQDQRNAVLDAAAVVASSLADPLVAAVMVAALVLAFWAFGRRLDAVTLALVAVPQGISFVMKALVDRPRPDLSILTFPPTNPGFPSGHSVHALVLFVLLIYLAGQLVETRWLRWTVQTILGLAILVVGASRVYLGIHWPSDVLGGYLLGMIGVAVIFWVRKKGFFRGLE